MNKWKMGEKKTETQIIEIKGSPQLYSPHKHPFLESF